MKKRIYESKIFVDPDTGEIDIRTVILLNGGQKSPYHLFKNKNWYSEILWKEVYLVSEQEYNDIFNDAESDKSTIFCVVHDDYNEPYYQLFIAAPNFPSVVNCLKKDKLNAYL